MKKVDLKIAFDRVFGFFRDAVEASKIANSKFKSRTGTLQRELLLNWFWHARWTIVRHRRDARIRVIVATNVVRKGWDRWVLRTRELDCTARLSVQASNAVWRLRGSRVRVGEAERIPRRRSIAEWREALGEMERVGRMDCVWIRWVDTHSINRRMRQTVDRAAWGRNRAVMRESFDAMAEHWHGCKHERAVIRRAVCFRARMGLLAMLTVTPT
eukprot:1543232-Rhodomonas_salina.2